MRIVETTRNVLLFLLLVAVPISSAAMETFVIDPERPLTQITVQRGAPFKLTVEERGWYLNRYDRSKLRFKSRIVDSSLTSFIMHPTAAGEASMLLSFKELHLPFTVKILEYSPGKRAEDLDAVSDRVEALRKRLQPVGDEGSREEEKVVKQPVENAAITEEQSSGTSAAPGQAGSEKQVASEPELFYEDKNKKIVKVPRTTEEDAFRRGRSHFHKGRHQKAEAELRRYLSKCETCASRDAARLLLAQTYLKGGRDEEALVLLDGVIESAQGQPSQRREALEKRAELYYRAGRLAEAAGDYERLYESEGMTAAGLQRLGDIYLRLNEEDKAFRWYEEGIAEGAHNDELLFRVASAYDSPGSRRDIEKAYRYYKLLTDTYDSSIYFDRARERVHFYEKHFFEYQ
jgi:tetratricopeptide (TPR) repeat protein